MSRTASPSGAKPYGLARVCRVWRVARSTVYRHRLPPPTEPPRRPGPVGPMADAALVAAIRGVLAASPFHGEGHRKVWARLRHAGVRTSKRRVLRLMARTAAAPLAGRLAPRPAQPRRHHHPRDGGQHVGHRPDHHLDRRGPGGGVRRHRPLQRRVRRHPRGPQANRFEALEPIRQGVRRCFGGFAQDIARGLAVRHDHGSQYMSGDFQKELRFLGIESSPAFVRAPEGNGCAERFIRTLKENLLWVRVFDTVEELRAALLEFRETYNSTWLIERHGFRPPSAVRQDRLSTAALAA
jgi:transposase InsO family protein